MQTGPIIKLTGDLHRIDEFLPLGHNSQGGFDYDMIIDRQRYDEVAALLIEYDICENQTISASFQTWQEYRDKCSLYLLILIAGNYTRSVDKYI